MWILKIQNANHSSHTEEEKGEGAAARSELSVISFRRVFRKL